MLRGIKGFIACLICVFVGCAAMYGIIYFFPNTIVKTITKEEVNIKDTGISKSVEKVYDAVIYVSAKTGTGTSTGTGFIYKVDKENGYIITNYHVVEGSTKINVILSNDETVEAKTIGGDEYADIAVLSVDKKYVSKTVTIGKSSQIKVGDTVFTIGAPMGLSYKGTVTKGILSGKDRMVSVSLNGNNSSSEDWALNVMQTDAAINPGNSGGPLCNVNGEVIGVNTLKIVKNEVEGLGFAIPIEDALTYAEKIEKHESTDRPYMGVAMINVSEASLYRDIKVNTKLTSGVIISEVEKSSPADKANLKVGDIIIKIENTKVSDIAELRYNLYKYTPGQSVKITINRDGKEKEVTIKLIKKEN